LLLRDHREVPPLGTIATTRMRRSIACTGSDRSTNESHV